MVNNTTNLEILSYKSNLSPQPHQKTHFLRRTRCTALYESGMPPEEIISITDHSSVQILYKYIKVNPDKKARSRKTVSYLRNLDQQVYSPKPLVQLNENNVVEFDKESNTKEPKRMLQENNQRNTIITSTGKWRLKSKKK